MAEVWISSHLEMLSSDTKWHLKGISVSLNTIAEIYHNNIKKKKNHNGLAILNI